MDQPDASAAVRDARRVCFFAHYNAGATVADHVIGYLDALAKSGFTIVLVSTSIIPECDRVKLRTVIADILVRENFGLDFAGWIDCCRKYFPISAEYLLLANDSVYAPLGNFERFFNRLVAVPADFYGAVESGERGRHLQSWFLLFRPSAYRSDAFRPLMLEPMPQSLSKAALIERYEVGLSKRLKVAGLTYHAAFTPLAPGRLAEARPYNAMHLLWDEVLKAGVPFLKVELLRLNASRGMKEGSLRPTLARYAPHLAPMIVSDLKTRGRARPPTRLELTMVPAINWPEVRFLVRQDFRRPLRWPLYLLAYRAIVALTRGTRHWLQRRSR